MSWRGRELILTHQRKSSVRHEDAQWDFFPQSQVVKIRLHTSHCLTQYSFVQRFSGGLWGNFCFHLINANCTPKCFMSLDNKRQKQEAQREGTSQLSLDVRGEFAEMGRHRDVSSAEAAAVALTVIRLGWGLEEGKRQSSEEKPRQRETKSFLNRQVITSFRGGENKAEKFSQERQHVIWRDKNLFESCSVVVVMYYMKRKQKIFKWCLLLLRVTRTPFFCILATQSRNKKRTPSNQLHESEFHFVKLNTSYKQHPI